MHPTIHYNEPFDYYIIDDFLEPSIAKKISEEFIPFESTHWFDYNNPLEIKKTLNNWYHFPETTYKFFSYLNSKEFVEIIQNITKTNNLYTDIGLHGAGWHIHGNGGKLNVHLDYSIHPKLKLQRKYNFIIYLSQEWDPKWGGNLEFWSHDFLNKKPKEKIAQVDCIFNRAVIFDTTKNSWHGFNDPITCPNNTYRKSIACYYLTDPEEITEERYRALYSASKSQENDRNIEQLIKNRSKL
jgi:Rps23 Pro-64 3,4-dihydroxylase Tpa1-like proline 4-hydroxylase